MKTENKMFGNRGFSQSEQEQIRHIASKVVSEKQNHLLEQMGIAEQSMRSLQEDFIYLRRQRESGGEVKKYILRSIIGAIVSGVIWLLLKVIKL